LSSQNQLEEPPSGGHLTTRLLELNPADLLARSGTDRRGDAQVPTARPQRSARAHTRAHSSSTGSPSARLDNEHYVD